MSALFGVFFGFLAYLVVRYVVFGFFTVAQNERAVKTSFGRAQRIDGTSLDDPSAATMTDDERQRYAYPQLRVLQPGGPYFRLPWQRVYKVSIATETISMAHDPEDPKANRSGTLLDAVTKDQLNIGLTGQIRYQVAERNLYAYLFGVKNPLAHVMGFFISILREKIAKFEAPKTSDEPTLVAGVSINDLRKNLRDINQHMQEACQQSSARYGIELDASLITGIDPPSEVESALAAINTAHNQVSADISLAQAHADQTLVQSRRAVEIETLRAEAEVEPLRALADQLRTLKESGGSEALDAYLRNLRLGLYAKADNAILEVGR